MCVCVCLCMDGGEKAEGKNGKNSRGGEKGEVCICMGLIHVGKMCGWYARRLWGIHMPSFLISFCTPVQHIYAYSHTHTHIHKCTQTLEWEESSSGCEELSSINTTHPISQHLLPHLPVPRHHLYFPLSREVTQNSF